MHPTDIDAVHALDPKWVKSGRNCASLTASQRPPWLTKVTHLLVQCCWFGGDQMKHSTIIWCYLLCYLEKCGGMRLEVLPSNQVIKWHKCILHTSVTCEVMLCSYFRILKCDIEETWRSEKVHSQELWRQGSGTPEPGILAGHRVEVPAGGTVEVSRGRGLDGQVLWKPVSNVEVKGSRKEKT